MNRSRLLAPAAALALLVSLGVAPALAADPPGVDDESLGTHLNDHDVTFVVVAVDLLTDAPPLSFALGTPAHGTAVLEGDVSCGVRFPTRECQQSARYSPEPGYAGADGFTYTATDHNGLAGTANITVTLVLDDAPPMGDLFVYSAEMAAATGMTRTTDLLVRAQATDNYGLGKLRLSNSGAAVGGMLTTFVETDYSSSGWPDLVPWQTLNATGGSSAEGLRTVYAQWSDRWGNWTPVKSATIRLDKTVPSVTALTVAFATTAPQSGVPIKLSFTTTENGTYELQRSLNAGAWTAMNYSIDNKTLTLGHSTSYSYRYRVRMHDAAGNWSSWRYSITFKPAYYAQSSSSIAYSGSWTRVTYTNGWGTARSRTLGNYARLNFTGKGVSWHAIKGPGRGKAQVYIDGTLVRTIDLYSSKVSTSHVYSKTWSSSGSHSIRVRVLGTSGRPYVEVDGFGVLR